MSAILTFLVYSLNKEITSLKIKQDTIDLVRIQQESQDSSIITVKDGFLKDAGFSMRFPDSWGLVSIKRQNQTDAGGNIEAPSRLMTYKFISEFRPYSHYIIITISHPNYKSNPLITLTNSIYITEDEKYYYEYDPSTEYCVSDNGCGASQITEIDSEITEIIKSFELL